MSAQVQVAVGTHNLTAPQAFGVEIYGAGSYDSYAYTGGQSLSVVSDVASLSLVTSSVSGVVGQQACVRVEVQDSNGAPVAGVRVDASISGVSGSISTNATANSSGIANICYTGTAAGSDTVALSANGFTASSVVTWSLALPSICNKFKSSSFYFNSFAICYFVFFSVITSNLSLMSCCFKRTVWLIRFIVSLWN
jgi:hypothetical protein